MTRSPRKKNLTHSRVGRRERNTPRRLSHSNRVRDERVWLLGGLVVYLAVAVTGIYVSFSSQQMRNLFTTLQRIQVQNDELLGEYSRLLLERGAVSSYLNVDRVAEQSLSMKFPELRDEVRRVER